MNPLNEIVCDEGGLYPRELKRLNSTDKGKFEFKCSTSIISFTWDAPFIQEKINCPVVHSLVL